MISGQTLILFLLAAGALILMPGPAVLFIVARSAHQGRRAGIASALGVASGGLVHVAGAVLGLSALLAASAVAFSAIRWVGAAYLIWLGIKTWRTRDIAENAAPPPAPLRRLFAQGFVVNLLNPKTALFFLAFLPQFVDPAHGHVTLQILQLGMLFALMGWCSDSTYALIAGTVAERIRGSLRLRRIQRQVSGGGLIALGVAAAFSGARSK